MRKEIEPRVLRRQLAEDYLGGAAMLERLIAAGEVQPLKAGGKLLLFDRRDLDAAVDRVKVRGIGRNAPVEPRDPARDATA